MRCPEPWSPRSLLLLTLLAGPGCQRPPPQPPAPPPDAAASQVAQEQRGSTLQPAPRQAGPPRPESPAQLAAAAQEARARTAALLAAGVAPREAASVADTLGYRLYRQRRFGQARAWFERAVAADPTYELSLYNAARCAALLGDLSAALRHLRRLQALDTPLARSRLALALTDPDLQRVRDLARNPAGPPATAGQRPAPATAPAAAPPAPTAPPR